jgi:hypothetical protein
MSDKNLQQWINIKIYIKDGIWASETLAPLILVFGF